MKNTQLLIFAIIMAHSLVCMAQWNTGSSTVHTTDKVGINTSNPSTQLSLGTTLSSKKLSLFDHNTYWYGFGVLAGQMWLQVGTTSDRFSFFAGNSAEVLTVTGDSKLGINASSPTSRLQVWSGITKFSVGSAYTSALGWGTSYIGFNAARSGSTWHFDGHGGNNGGSAIYGTVGGSLFFVCKPTTGGSNTTVSDVDIMDKVKMKVFWSGKVAIGDAPSSDNDYLLYPKESRQEG